MFDNLGRVVFIGSDRLSVLVILLNICVVSGIISNIIVIIIVVISLAIIFKVN